MKKGNIWLNQSMSNSLTLSLCPTFACFTPLYCQWQLVTPELDHCHSIRLKAPQCNYLRTCQSITALDKPARLIIRPLFGLKNTEAAMLSKKCPYHMSQTIFVCIDFSVSANWKFICVVVLVCFYYKAQAGVFVSVFVCFIRLVSNIDRALLIQLKMSR